MRPEPEITDLETIEHHSAYQSLQPVQRPSYWGVDLALERRPGVPSNREPKPFPNTKFPVEPQRGGPSSPKHGRPNKSMPPVFGTAVPMHGLSGAIRQYAAQYPDHYPRFWLLKLFSDRVDSWTYHAKKLLPFALPMVAAGAVAGITSARRRSEPAQPVGGELRGRS